MMFRTHIVLSLLFALFIFPLFSINKGLYLLIFLFAALLPDIDNASSFIGKRVKIIGWVFRHRGIFHSFFMLLVLSSAVYIIFNSTGYAVVFALGYLSHLLADTLTREGVRPLFPLSLRVRGPLRSNSLTEKAIFIICLVLGFVLLLR